MIRHQSLQILSKSLSHPLDLSSLPALLDRRLSHRALIKLPHALMDPLKAFQISLRPMPELRRVDPCPQALLGRRSMFLSADQKMQLWQLNFNR